MKRILLLMTILVSLFTIFSCEKEEMSKSISVKDLTCEVSVKNVTTHGGHDGEITVTVLTGNGDYIYSLNDTVDVDGDGKFTNLSAKKYNLKVEDSEGKRFLKDTVLTEPNIEQTKPTVEIQSATNVTQTTVTLSGKVNPNGYVTTDLKFEYGTSTSYGSNVTLTNISGNTLTNVSKDINGLTPNTIYHYRLVATNIGGTTTSDDKTFTTLQVGTPSVNTLPSSEITETSAKLNGSVNPNGYTIRDLKFEYGLTSSYGTSVIITNVSGSTLTNVNVTINDLSPNVTYHYRLVAVGDFDPVNMKSVLYTGNDMTFTTIGVLKPIVITSNATVTQTTAKLNGSVNPNGFTTINLYFEYGTSDSYGSVITLTNLNGNTLTNLSKDISGLKPNTLYHYRLVATNIGGTTLGDDKTFTTNSWKIGDELYGGIVFEVDNTGQHGKIVQKTDESTGMTWDVANNGVTRNGLTWELPTFDYMKIIYNYESTMNITPLYSLDRYWTKTNVSYENAGAFLIPNLLYTEPKTRIYRVRYVTTF